MGRTFCPKETVVVTGGAGAACAGAGSVPMSLHPTTSAIRATAAKIPERSTFFIVGFNLIECMVT
jgi:hypothetical protein